VKQLAPILIAGLVLFVTIRATNGQPPISRLTQVNNAGGSSGPRLTNNLAVNRRRSQQRQDTNPYGRFYQPAQVVAEVGKETVFLSDIMPRVNEVVASGKIPPDQLETQRVRLIQSVLGQVIRRKMLVQEFILAFPPGKREEMQAKVEEKAQQIFNEALPKFLKNYKVSSAAGLDAKLRKFGSSLSRRRQTFFETQLAQATIFKNVPRNPLVSFDELLAYYEENQVRYQKSARVRWEQLTVRFDKVPNKRDAFGTIASMGNEIRLGGAKFSAVAKRRSQGINADTGGYHDWVTKGSLSSTKIDRVIFAIKPNLLSRIIEDDRGYHIVRVLAHERAGRVPFDQVQEEIKKKIQAKKSAQAREKFYKRLAKKYPVRTIYDRRPRQPPPQKPNAVQSARTSAFDPR